LSVGSRGNESGQASEDAKSRPAKVNRQKIGRPQDAEGLDHLQRRGLGDGSADTANLEIRA